MLKQFIIIIIKIDLEKTVNFIAGIKVLEIKPDLQSKVHTVIPNYFLQYVFGFDFWLPKILATKSRVVLVTKNFWQPKLATKKKT